MAAKHTPRLFEEVAPDRVWLVGREVYIPARWNMSALDHGDEYLTYVRSDAFDDMLAALKSLCDGDAAYFDNEIRIRCADHGGAIETMRLAREAIAKASA